MIYLASPYTGTPEEQQWRADQACAAFARLIYEGVFVYSPIAANHHLKLPGDWNFWGDYDCDMIDACSEVWVLALPDWKTSMGVIAECAYALKQGKRVRKIDPVTWELTELIPEAAQ